MLTKKNVLWVVLSMLVVTAAVGIWAVFSDHIGKTQEKILLTTGIISAACILMLPCLAHTERKYLCHAAWTGVILILGTAVLTIAVVWIEPGSRVMEKVMASGWVASAAAFATNLDWEAFAAAVHRWSSITERWTLNSTRPALTFRFPLQKPITWRTGHEALGSTVGRTDLLRAGARRGR